MNQKINLNDNRAVFRKNIKWPFISLGVGFIILVPIFLWFFSFYKTAAQENEPTQPEVTEPAESSANANETESTVVTNGAKTQAQYYHSENYTMPDVAVGEGTLVLISGQRALKLEVEDIKSEGYIKSGSEDSNLVISWTSNKLSDAVVRYSRKGSADFKEAIDTNFGFTHSVILQGLEPSTVYLFQIKSRDKWGNEYLSDQYTVRSGAHNISIIDLMIDAFYDAFGWAIKK